MLCLPGHPVCPFHRLIGRVLREAAAVEPVRKLLGQAWVKYGYIHELYASLNAVNRYADVERLCWRGRALAVVYSGACAIVSTRSVSVHDDTNCKANNLSITLIAQVLLLMS